MSIKVEKRDREAAWLAYYGAQSWVDGMAWEEDGDISHLEPIKRENGDADALVRMASAIAKARAEERADVVAEISDHVLHAMGKTELALLKLRERITDGKHIGASSAEGEG